MADKQVSVRISAQGGDKLKAELTDIGREGQRSFQALETSSSSAGRGLQNTAFQVGDFFVQISSGTDVMRAAAMQLPQLLGGFGLFGAIAGAVAAALPAIWGLFSDGTGKMRSAEDAQRDLNEATNEYSRSAAAAVQPMDVLIQKYGSLAQEVRDLQVAEAELARGRAIAAVDSAIQVSPLNVQGAEGVAVLRALRQDFRAPSAEMAAASEGLEQLRSDVSDLAREYGITRDEAERLVYATNELANADGVRAQAAAAAALTDELVTVFGSIEAADRATGGLVSQLLDAGFAAADVAATDMASPIGNAAGQAAILSANLASAAAYSSLLGTTGQSSGPDSVRSKQFGGGVFTPVVSGAGLAYVPPKATGGRGGGGGGGGSGVDRDRQDAMREAERLFEQTRSSAEKYEAEMKRLDALLAGGFITQDTYNRGLDLMKKKYGEVGDAAKAFKDINAELKDAVLDLATGSTASFDQIAKSIERATLQAALFGEGPLGEFFGGGLMKIMGKGLGIPSFEGGGFTGRGSRSGGMDGKGGFLAMLHPDEDVLDRTGPAIPRLRAGPASGGAVVQINNYTGQPVQEERSRGPNGEAVIRVTVGKQLQRGEHDKSMKRFGMRPAAVKR